jgi:hypothetical protein
MTKSKHTVSVSSALALFRRRLAASLHCVNRASGTLGWATKQTLVERVCRNLASHGEWFSESLRRRRPLTLLEGRGRWPGTTMRVGGLDQFGLLL